MRRIALLTCIVLASGCAAIDPYVQVGPEETRGRSQTDLPPSAAAASLDESLRLLQERRGEMMQKARELTWLSSGSRLVAGGGVGTGIGGLIFNANGTLIAASALTAGGAYLIGQGFAPATARLVYLTGAQALSCVERQAVASVSEPVTDPAVLRPAEDALRTLGEAIARADAAGADPQTIAEARTVQARLSSLLAGLDRGVIASPALAAAIAAKTVDIALQVNRELEKAIPDINAIISLAQGVNSVAMQAIVGGAAQGRADASPAPALAGPLPQAALRSATPAAREAETVLHQAMLTAKAEDRRLRGLIVTRQAPAVAAVGACAFEGPAGQAVTLSVPNPASVRTGGALAVLVDGGRGPYRITPTGQVVQGLTASPEYSRQAFTVTARAGLANGTTASWLVEDAGNPQAKPATLTVTVGP